MNAYSQNNFTTTIQNTNNYLIPDGMDRCIHDLQDKTFHVGVLENGHIAYLMELPDLKPLLSMSRYLMDEVTGQFYAIYGNSYQSMCTIPRLLHTWEPGQLMDELATTRCAFGYMGLTGPTPAPQPNQPPPVGPVSTTNNEEMIPDLTTRKPPPITIPYHQSLFNLDRLTRCLTKDERIEVHHNYISAPHNILTYEAEMTRHIALHDDVLGRIHTILKQDDYFRTLEDLPPIDGLSAYDDIMLFPELFCMILVPVIVLYLYCTLYQ